MATSAKWGILGCASIAEKFCVSVSEAENATCVAVASRDKSKAEAWIEANCPGARAYGSYDELLADEEIQAVYIPLPTGLRAEWVLKAASKKKHVLGEKPIATCAAEAQRILDACREAGVQYMDNTMFMHNERTAAMRAVLDDTESFGVPKSVVSNFTLPAAADGAWDNVRMKASTEPFGALGDLGWYCLRVSLWAFNYADAEAVSCHYLQATDEGVPLHCTGTIKFSEGRAATFDCSFVHAWRESAEVFSSKKCLFVEDFVIPGMIESGRFMVSQRGYGKKALCLPLESVKYTDVGGRGCLQHTKLVENMSKIVLSGELQAFWPRISLQTQLLMGACEASAKAEGRWVKIEEFAREALAAAALDAAEKSA